MLGFIDLSNLTRISMMLVDCGLFTTDSDTDKLAYLTKGAVFLIQVGVPIILVIMGMIDMGKAVMAQKEDDIKKAQQVFVTRLIAAAITFLIITVVKVLIGVFGKSTDAKFMSCFNYFVNGTGMTTTGH